MISLSWKEIEENFPYLQIRPCQKEAFSRILETPKSVHEIPFGEGKTAIGLTLALALFEKGFGPIYYVTPTKTEVEQIITKYPGEFQSIYGKNEYLCLFYQGKINADEAPCHLLDCPHKVDIETGIQKDPNVEPCEYYLRKSKLREDKITITTTAFFVIHALYQIKGFEKPQVLVIDEVHRIADIVRRIVHFRITDLSIKRIEKALKTIGEKEELEKIKSLKETLAEITLGKRISPPELLDEYEIEQILQKLLLINPQILKEAIKTAIRTGKIDPQKEEERKILKTIEDIIYRLNKWVRALYTALPAERRKPLSFVVAIPRKPSYEEKKKTKEKYGIEIYSWYVAPLIKKVILENIPWIICYSGTIGDPEKFKFETGIDFKVFKYSPSIPRENILIFMPNDTPELAYERKEPDALEKAFSMIQQGCLELLKNGHRSLILVVSEEERKKFFESFTDGFECLTYNERKSPKEVAQKFIQGKGDVLLGTAANYGEGLDLPGKIASAIFYLRPEFPRPDEPQVQFERKRFGEQTYWGLQRWRVNIKTQQAIKRHIRGPEDKGVSFLISQHFKRTVSFPEWERERVREKSFTESLKEAKEFLSS